MKKEKEIVPLEFNKKGYVDIRKQIMKPTDKVFIEQRPGRGGKKFNYVQTGYIIMHLNKTFGFNWDFEVLSEERVEDQIVVKGKLTAKDSFGVEITKTQFGSSTVKFLKVWDKDEKKYISSDEFVSLGDDYKAASSDCLKKCASLLGIAFDIYYPDVWKIVKKAMTAHESKPKVEVIPVVSEPTTLDNDKVEQKAIAQKLMDDVVEKDRFKGQTKAGELMEKGMKGVKAYD